MAFGYRYTLEPQDNGWWLVRFPGIPEALTEGAGHSGPDRAVLPSLVTAKLAVYETMRVRGWSKVKLAKELGMSENSVRRLLDLHHSSQMWVIDDALAKMNAKLPIDLPKLRSTGKAA